MGHRLVHHRVKAVSWWVWTGRRRAVVVRMRRLSARGAAKSARSAPPDAQDGPEAAPVVPRHPAIPHLACNPALIGRRWHR